MDYGDEDYGDENDGRDIDIWSPDGPRMLAEQCATCIFRPGNPMHLDKGQLRAITEQARHADSFIVCHSTLPGLAPAGVGPAACRGFADRYDTNYLRVMRRLGGFHEVPAPTTTT